MERRRGWRLAGLIVLHGCGVALVLVSLMMLLSPSPALALQKDEPAKPEERSSTGRAGTFFPVTVTEDGYVREGFDIFVWCGNVSASVDEEYLQAEFEATLYSVEEGALERSEVPSKAELRARFEEESARQVEACREAGFPTADDRTAEAGPVPAPQGALPGTGGVPTTGLLSVTGLLLTGLAAGCCKAWRAARSETGGGRRAGPF